MRSRPPQVAGRLANLAVCLLALGRVSQTLPPAERALAITETAFGPGHGEVARPWGSGSTPGDLAASLRMLGRIDEAVSLQEGALTITELMLGPDHPDVASALGCQAVVMLELGRRTRRFRWRSGHWPSSSAACGPEHPQTVALKRFVSEARQKPRGCGCGKRYQWCRADEGQRR